MLNDFEFFFLLLQQKKLYLKIFFTDMGAWKSSLVNISITELLNINILAKQNWLKMKITLKALLVSVRIFTFFFILDRWDWLNAANIIFYINDTFIK